MTAMNATLDRIPRKEFAAELGVDPRTLDRWCRLGIDGVRLTAIYIGVRVYFTREDWTAFQDALAKVRSRPPGRTALETRKDRLAEEAAARREGLQW